MIKTKRELPTSVVRFYPSRPYCYATLEESQNQKNRHEWKREKITLFALAALEKRDTRALQHQDYCGFFFLETVFTARYHAS